MKKWKLVISVVLSVLLMAGSLTTLAGCSKKDGPNDIQWFIAKHDGVGKYYDKYEESMVVQWINNQKWDGENGGYSKDGASGDKLNFSFIAPIAGAEQEALNTMIISGDYADLIDLQLSTSSAKQLIEDGVLMDITEYVEKYMPNYTAYLDANPQIKGLVTEKDSDGKTRYNALYQIFNTINWPFQGFSYRRDWVVKYGTPSTHVWDRESDYVKTNGHPKYTPLSEATAKGDYTGWKTNTVTSFTGSDGDGDPNETYTDNVIFPSGTSDPLYISDWEWMFPFFKEAISEKGLTGDKDSYCMTVGYGGYAGTGDLMSSFGGGSPNWYYDKEGKARFGGTGENFKVYLDCINNWYNQGWLDTKFNERNTDMFYKINVSGVTQGKVGMWQGNLAYLGAFTRETTEDPDTMVFGCPQPINDVYGTDANKFVVPDVFFQQGMLGGGTGVSVAAKDKNIPALFAYLDWLYTEEGSLTIGYGLNQEQYESMTFEKDLFVQKGIKSAYIRTDYDDGTFTVRRGSIAEDSDYCNALTGFRMNCFLNSVKEEVKDYKKIPMASVENWRKYTASGQVIDYTGLMMPTESNTYNTVNGRVTTHLDKNVPSLIKTKGGVKEKDWNDYCTALNKLGADNVTKIYQAIRDRLN